MAEREATLNEVLFIGLILNLQASAMIGLGKIMNPMTQKIERNLDQARMTIDMLGMLEEKTKGNRSDEETETLQRALTELRMNYLDELKKNHAELEKEEAEKEAAAKEQGTQAEAEVGGTEGPGVREGASDAEKRGTGDDVPETGRPEEGAKAEEPASGEKKTVGEPARKQKASPTRTARAQEKKRSEEKGRTPKKGDRKSKPRSK